MLHMNIRRQHARTYQSACDIMFICVIDGWPRVSGARRELSELRLYTRRAFGCTHAASRINRQTARQLTESASLLLLLDMQLPKTRRKAFTSAARLSISVHCEGRRTASVTYVQRSARACRVAYACDMNDADREGGKRVGIFSHWTA